MEKKKDLKTLGVILTIFIISLLYYFNKVNNENKVQNDNKVRQISPSWIATGKIIIKSST